MLRLPEPIALGALSAMLGISVANCATTTPEATSVAAYAAALDMCVATSTTLEESRACRCEVNKAFNRPCKDAGVTDDAR